MKKNNFLLAFVFFTYFVNGSVIEQNFNKNIECNKTENFSKSGKIISPDGFVVAQSLLDLETAIFADNKEASIISIDFVSIGNAKGAIAFIDFKDNGVNKRWGFAIGDIKVGYTGKTVTLTKGANTNLESNSTIFKCDNIGYNYVESPNSFKTGEYKFYCKCENNTDTQNELSIESFNGKN